MGGSNSTETIKGDMMITFTYDKIVAGQSLEGSIILNFKTECPPANLSINVVGYESGFFREQAKKNHGNSAGQERRFSEKILDQTFMLKQYNERLQPGTHVSKFKIDLPAWLPASLMDSPVGWSSFKVEYLLNAQFSAQDKKACPKYLTTSKMFKIERPLNEVPQENLAVDFKNTFGGLMGLG